ncbi:MAG: LPS export ABC transporter periplasmic protein LptC [Desulfomonile tiedjei]|uniref:LPS export ABC transporter periplasmic protein LptC n=1 Tax=Desulfomonile tiedjei TaxID=2358 RepID=A0A9D6V299_9BACT|nr:LPS export ABC transporter periplasmic protein LptC [Desulfomonile tiedjei]
MNHKEIERWHRLRNLKRAAQVMVVAAVVLVVSGYAASRFFHDTSGNFEAKSTGGAGMRIEKFSYSSPGAHPWELEALSAAASTSLDKVTLTQPRVVYNGGRGGKIFLTADTGDLDKLSSNVIARGNVTIRYEDFVFAAGDINYCQEKKIAETASPVSLEGVDFRLEGKGLKMSIQDEEIVIEQDVKARLFNVRWAEPNKVPM